MNVIPKRKSKKQKALKKAGKTAAKAKAVQKAPKAAATVWAGKRSGKIVKGAIVAVVGVVTLKAIRSKMKGGDQPAPPQPQSYRATETPASSQQTGATPGHPSPSGPTATAAAKDDAVASAATASPASSAPKESTPGNAEPAPDPGQSATPPHGDKAADDLKGTS
ncbi:hypothetical protein [Capillimicrobium parvum]|uniref:Uncharacterized protein n=1 Tax=Capillimicrobium parvum TaxID=2884022 RepID=A0A9E6Y2N9_9ACTN|nr:hypothetical protein [Capillimicrobium parvum]UGS38793.1 hypothetical protein DSM104329_05223 [Capillimicrobium parvum]